MALIDTSGIRPIERRQPTDDLSRVRRREEGTSSAFRPQTNVALKTAIQDLAATLSKISSEEKYGVQKMPKEIGDVVKNILRQSFSMDSTLNKGIGSTIESQRFSMDQLMLFSRMLLQMGTLAEKGYSMKINDETQLLLTNLKNVIVAEAGNEELEPVLMMKSAFDLVDAKVAEQLPQALYEILAQLANMPAAIQQQQQPQSEGMQFLKQLIRYFIPRPEVDNPAQEQEQKQKIAQQQQDPQNQQNQQSRSPSAQRFLDSMFKNFGGRFSQQAQNAPQGQQTQFNQNQPQEQQTQFNQNQPQGQQTQFNQNQPQGQQAQFNQNQPQNQQTQFNQNQPQNQQTQFNQNQPQNQQTQFNQNQPQNQQTQFNQNQPQNQQTQFNQNQPQGQQAQFNQNQPQNQQTQFNQNQPQGQQTQFNQPQGQQAQFNQNQPQGQQTQFNQPQGQQTQFNQNQPQGQQAQFNQNQPQGQQTQFNQPQGQQTQFNQNQPQGQQTQFNQNQPQNQQTQFNQNQPQNQQAQFNQNQPQPQGQQTQFNQPQNQQTQFNQNQPQNQQAQFNQNQPQNQQAQFNQNQPQNQQAQFNQNQPQPQGQQTQFNQPQNQQAQFNQNQPQGQQAQVQSQPQIPEATFPLSRAFIHRQKDMRRHMELAKNDLIKTQLQNTPQTNDAMKNLAQFLMRNTSMTPRDTALLKNFVNNSQQTMSETEARHLQNLLRLCQQNIPLTVRQAAVQQNLPDLPRLWAFMQMCDMAGIASKMNPKTFKRAGKDVAAFATAMRSAMSSDNTVVQNQRAFQMMIPLYMGDNEVSYPTYFNIYDENERDPDTGEDKKETWVRICILTDHIGAAELVFRIYEETRLDMRFYFSQTEIAKEFGNIYVNELKNYMKQVTLQLGEISVGSVGEGLFNY